MTSFDDILEEVGKFGRYQRRIFAMMCMVSLPWAGVYVGIVFQGFTPDHWCRDSGAAERGQTCGWSQEQTRRLTRPVDNSSGTPQPSTCTQFDLDWNSTELSCDAQALNLSRTSTRRCQEGWEYDYEGRQSFVTEVTMTLMDRMKMRLVLQTSNKNTNFRFSVGNKLFLMNHCKKKTPQDPLP